MAAQTTGQGDLARRYASAVFELALEQDKLDVLAKDLEDLSDLLDTSADLSRLVKSPVISRSDQWKDLNSLG